MKGLRCAIKTVYVIRSPVTIGKESNRWQGHEEKIIKEECCASRLCFRQLQCSGTGGALHCHKNRCEGKHKDQLQLCNEPVIQRRNQQEEDQGD